jgi:hypothetical protein
MKNKNINIFLTIFFSVVFLFFLVDSAKADCYYFCSQRDYCDCGKQGTAGLFAPVNHSVCLIGEEVDIWCGFGHTEGAVSECTNAAGTRKCKGSACPDVSDPGWNGKSCFVSRDCWGWGCYSQDCSGKWDASQKWCVECSGNIEVKRFGSSSGIDVNCGNCDGFDIPDTCETACNSNIDPKCDDKSPGDTCETGKKCDVNCQCTADGELPPPPQPPGDYGGLVPCGRPGLPECQLCHLFVLIDNILHYLFNYIVAPVALLVIVIGGISLITAGGDPQKVQRAKSIITSAAIGLAILSLSLVFLYSFLDAVGVAEWTGLKTWWHIDCP